MSLILFSFIAIVLYFFELLYFKIAKHFKIMDTPNDRSSHQTVTIRGGGIIFIVSMVFYPVFFDFKYNYFLIGLLFAGLISFVDDLSPLSNKVRICFHLIASALIFYQLGMSGLPIFYSIIAIILTIGIINAINFMDGINGMTGLYAFVTLASLLCINEFIVEDFISSNLIIMAMLSVSIFNFFNFRKLAKCFAGDVGSVSMAFILIYIISQLILTSEDFSYILLLLVYGLDTVTTILFRLIRKEDIFKAHRSHLYQYLVNERKMSHLYVSTLYSIVQLLFNLFIIYFFAHSLIASIIFMVLTSCLFLLIRFKIEGKERLLKPYN